MKNPAKKRFKRHSLPVLFFTLLTSQLSNATPITCRGHVNEVHVSGDGRVLVTMHNSDGTVGLHAATLCQLGHTLGRYSAEGCNALFSLLTSAMYTDKEVILWMTEGESLGCSQDPWSRLDQQGFYHAKVFR
ncbi:hypothetical protein GCM10008940_02170 [Microbulbifer agarilyticus]